MSDKDPKYCQLIRSYSCVNVPKATQKYEAISYSKFSENEKKIFHAFLKSIDGGQKGEKNAYHYSSKTRQVLHGMDAISHEDIVNPEKIEKLKLFYMSYAENHSNSSVSTLIFCFIKYINYLMEKVGANDPIYLTYDWLIKKLKRWNSGFANKARRTISFKNLKVPPEDIIQFERSDIYKETVDMLEEFASSTEAVANVNDVKHAQIRSFLILNIILRNCHRPIVICNMTLAEFSDPSPEEEDGEDIFVVKVADHKTANQQGFALVSIPAILYNYCEIYIEALRKRLEKKRVDGSRSNSVFLTYSGSDVGTSDIIQGMKTIWKKAGLQSNILTGALRKTITTKVHKEESPSKREDLANQLCHKTSTAESSYKIHAKCAQSAKTTNFIYKKLRETKDKETKNGTSIPSVDLEIRSKGRSCFNNDERKLLCVAFWSYVNNGIVPPAEAIRQTLETDQTLEMIPMEKKTIRSIKGCLQNYVNKALKGNLPSLEEITFG